VADLPKSSDSPEIEEIDLKDPALAVLLAWLVPGLGHWYQGRKAKAALYFFCIMGLFGYGVYLGGGSYVDQNQKKRSLGYGRAVYCSFRKDDFRWPYLLQVGAGLPSLPALVQASRMNNHQKVWFDGFMAPPLPSEPELYRREYPDDPNADQPSLHELHRHLTRYFELASFFTMVAGLLNVLAIYDAAAGPVTIIPSGKKEEKEEKEEPTPES
jgi:hypothetical protein